MGARYQVPVSDELLEAWDESRLPEGWHIVEIGPLDAVKRSYLVTVDDDNAPEELNGCIVHPWLQLQPDRTVIITGRDIVQ